MINLRVSGMPEISKEHLRKRDASISSGIHGREKYLTPVLHTR